MEKLLEKLDILKKSLDETKEITKIKELNQKIKENKELTELIEKYQYTKKDSVKEQIISNKIYREYKESETDINILILEINNKLNEITNKGKCGL